MGQERDSPDGVENISACSVRALSHRPRGKARSSNEKSRVAQGGENPAEQPATAFLTAVPPGFQPSACSGRPRFPLVLPVAKLLSLTSRLPAQALLCEPLSMYSFSGLEFCLASPDRLSTHTVLGGELSPLRPRGGYAAGAACA